MVTELARLEHASAEASKHQSPSQLQISWGRSDVPTNTSTDVRRVVLTRFGYEVRSSMKLNASLAGSASRTMTVRAHLRETGARGVPNGFVEAKNSG